MKEHFEKYRHRLTDAEKEEIWREIPVEEAALRARRKRQFLTGLSVAGASVVAVLAFAVFYGWNPDNLDRFDRIALQGDAMEPYVDDDVAAEIRESVSTPAERERLAASAAERGVAPDEDVAAAPVETEAEDEGEGDDVMMTYAPEAFPLGAVAEGEATVTAADAAASRAGPGEDVDFIRTEAAAPPAASEESPTVAASPSDRRGPAAVRQAGKGMRSEDVTLPTAERATARADAAKKGEDGVDGEGVREDKMRALVGDFGDAEDGPEALTTGGALEAEAKTRALAEQREAQAARETAARDVAQGKVATVSGRVFNADSGEPLAFANVVAVGTQYVGMTLMDGSFSFALPCGTYTLEISYIGYDRTLVENLKVCGEVMAPLEIAMMPAIALELETMIVEGEAPSVDVKSSEVKRARDADERNFAVRQLQDAMALDAGISMRKGEGRGSGAQGVVTPGQAAHWTYEPEYYREADRWHTQPRRRRCWVPPGWNPPNGEAYDTVFFEHYGVNPFIMTEDDAFSTFAIDVDNASYTIARRYLDDGNTPPADAIRVEEFVNFFDQDYEAPRRDDFAIRVDGMESPFGDGYHLLRVGIQGREVDARERKPANLIFVVDTSGSMGRENRLGLVKRALSILLDELEDNDTVGIVEYGSRGRVVLRPTSLEDRREIERAIDRLHTNGSTNAEEGLELGYEMASRIYSKRAVNRLILCSDGVANTGETQAERILDKVRYESDRGIMLSTIGFGMGNYNDVLMEKLADKGDGNYYYVDRLEEAERVFRENLTGTLQTIARDAKIQVEFDPGYVSRYRLLGYENRDVADEDFRNDSVDAGEIGAGHTVTALYEIKLESNGLADRERGRRRMDLGVVRVRYEKPQHEGRDAGEVVEIEQPIAIADVLGRYERADARLKVAAVAAEFAEILRESFWAKGSSLSDLAEHAEDLDDELRDEDVRELVRLIERAERIHSREDRRR